jgi:hypothetical protein
MKKELTVHLSFAISTFIFISIFRRWISLSFVPFWFGGLVGTFLPDVDHLIYLFLLRPYELTSQRVSHLVGQGSFWRSLTLLAETRSERTKLILHTAFFQIIFLIASFLVITSSGQLFGRGLVLAFLLHLLVDQLIDLLEIDSLDNWFRGMPFSLDKEKALFYWLANLVVFLILAFLF